MKYLLTIQVRFDAFDDPDARQKAYDIFELTKINESLELSEDLGCNFKVESKLQQIKEKDVPRKVEI
jgi:hypothetical protein